MPAPATKFTNVRITGTLTIDSGTATAAAGAATLNKQVGVVTTEPLVTAAGAAYTLTLSNSTILGPDSTVSVSVGNGTNTGGSPTIGTVAVGTKSVVITVRNTHATTAFNGTLRINFTVWNPYPVGAAADEESVEDNGGNGARKARGRKAK